MGVNAGLVAGSHNRNELIVICRDGESAVSLLTLPTLILFIHTYTHSYALLILLMCHCRLEHCSNLVDKYAIYVEMKLVSLWMETCLWPVTSVPFPYAELATSTNAEKETNSVLSARHDSNVSRVRLLSTLLLNLLCMYLCSVY